MKVFELIQRLGKIKPKRVEGENPDHLEVSLLIVTDEGTVEAEIDEVQVSREEAHVCGTCHHQKPATYQIVLKGSR